MMRVGNSLREPAYRTTCLASAMLAVLAPVILLVTALSFFGCGGGGPSPPATPHSVTLTWDQSTSTVTGYNVYRGPKSGGPYTKLNPNAVATTSYTDTAVQAGQTYYYVTTAVDSNGVQSVYSNEVSATVPSP